MTRPRNPTLVLTVITFVIILGMAWIVTRENSDTTRGGEAISTAPANTRTSDRPAPPDDEELRRRQQSISLAAEKWYQQLLEKYPDMKPVFRDVPDEQNGYLQFILFANALKEPRLPEELSEMLNGQSPWDAGKFKSWLAKNQDYADQILRIAELPGHSTKGIELKQFNALRRLPKEFGAILLSSARLAFENGDSDSALRHMRASLQLSNHFVDIEAPSLLGKVVAEQIRIIARDSFYENILPSISGNPEALSAWEVAFSHKETSADEYARVLNGEWNLYMRHILLPAFLGEPVFGKEKLTINDPDSFIDAYTATLRKASADISALGPDRYNIAGAGAAYDTSNAGLTPASTQMLEKIFLGAAGLAEAFGHNVTRMTMNSAALAVLQGKELPRDPVSGDPFQWDPKNRLLSPPAGTQGLDPIKVP